ncbi:MAG: virulence factor [Pseudomonadota bacterium]|jgi:hypothetical protein|nr:hypothetical protein [Porticoccaceae bacterium]MCH2560688.1 virulence factor [Pseudomonadales bacterium]MEC7158343.1 virulence factor [Pseudomonadota bacterium]MAL68521.1 hypothetical protein [Porticoccaceae bacterium]MAN54642.1 hypothetical protein [Porticoccaceae bacterium]|tara:strand:- start:198 stop:503 length:306 start_codon:yes stop_codon:yes gene_type:complete
MKKILVFWRDIPAQVLVRRGRDKAKVMLSNRFQVAIDRAAMRAGRGGSEQYLEDWRRETSLLETQGTPSDVAASIASEIEKKFSDEDIKTLIKNKGLNKIE